jgi:glycosyltransferase involved in cell wall biosynthesis
MRILVNCYDLLDSRSGAGGAGSYILALLPELARKAQVSVICSPRNWHCFRSDLGYRLIQLVANTYQDVLPLAASFDIFFCPLSGLSPPLIDLPIPIVCTILDLQHVHFPHLFRGGIFESRHIHYGAAIARADAVLTISHFEQDNIRRTYRKEAVHVSHLTGYLADGRAGARDAPTLSAAVSDLVHWAAAEPYLVYPAVPWPHKNHARLLQAFHMLRKSDDRFSVLKLVLTGAREHSLMGSGLAEMMEGYRLTRHVADLGFVEDGDLAWLITNAEAMVFPSLYEGFGIPLVDAMKLGIPAIGTRCGSIPEVCGDAIAYFSDPYDPRVMAAELAAFLTDEARKGLLRSGSRGPARAFAAAGLSAYARVRASAA